MGFEIRLETQSDLSFIVKYYHVPLITVGNRRLSKKKLMLKRQNHVWIQITVIIIIIDICSLSDCAEHISICFVTNS